MKSNVCKLTGTEGLQDVLREVEKCAAFNELDVKQTRRLRLLAEELVGMMPALLENATGTFMVENKGTRYDLHVRMKARETGFNTREKLMAVSSTGTNAAATGIMGKIRAAAEMMLFPDDDVVVLDFYDYGAVNSMAYNHMWSLRQYSDQVKEKEEEWDELEKSIVAKLADDVIVGIKGKQVDIIVRKTF